MRSRGVGLICRVMHADPLAYNNCFLLSQIDTKNRLLYYARSYICPLPTCLPFLLNKMQFYQTCYHKEMFQKVSGGRTVFKNSKKSSHWESYDAHSKKTCSTDSLQAQQLGQSCDPPTLSCLPDSLNNPWVP